MTMPTQKNMMDLSYDAQKKREATEQQNYAIVKESQSIFMKDSNTFSDSFLKNMRVKSPNFKIINTKDAL